MAVKSSTSSKSSAPAKTTSSVSSAVKAQQTALNALGANLKVDGIYGPLTAAAAARFASGGGVKGSTATASGGMTTSGGKTVAPVYRSAAIPVSGMSGGSSKIAISSQPVSMDRTNKGLTFTDPKSNILSSSSSPSNKKNVIKQKEGNFVQRLLGNLGNSFADIVNRAGAGNLGGNAYSAMGTPLNKKGETVLRGTVGENMTPAQTQTAYDMIQPGRSVAQTGLTDPYGRNVKVPTFDNTPLNTQDAFRSGGLSLNAGQENNQELTGMTNTGLVGEDNLPMESYSTLEQPLTTEQMNQSVSSGGLTSPGYYPMAIDTTKRVTDAITSATDSIINKKDNVWNKPEFANDVIAVKDNLASDIASMYGDATKLMAEYTSNPNVNLQINEGAKKLGVTPEQFLADITSKIRTGTGQIAPAQTTAEYLANAQGISRDVTRLMNEQIEAQLGYTQQMKDAALAAVTQQKEDAARQIEILNQREFDRKTSERERAQISIDKARAEFESADAENEAGRLASRSQLIEFLAKIGALNTDANTSLGLAALEQKYQDARNKLKAGFETASREINFKMNDAINEIESKRDEDALRINSDLSKTEREIAIEMMKLDYGARKDILDAKLTYANMIQSAKEKAAAAARSSKAGFESAFFDTASTADYFAKLPKEFRDTWFSNNMPSTDGTRTTLAGDKGLAQDYANWSKNQANAFQITDSKAFELQSQGVDVAAYKTDAEYRDFINKQLRK